MPSKSSVAFWNRNKHCYTDQLSSRPTLICGIISFHLTAHELFHLHWPWSNREPEEASQSICNWWIGKHFASRPHLRENQNIQNPVWRTITITEFIVKGTLQLAVYIYIKTIDFQVNLACRTKEVAQCILFRYFSDHIFYETQWHFR
jgi:hypothetical protein